MEEKIKYRDSFSQAGGKQEKSYGSIFRNATALANNGAVWKKAALQQLGF